MNAEEILLKITSRDTTKVWEAACAIIALSQNNKEIAPLKNTQTQIKNATKNLSMGGAFASNQRFIDYAIRIIAFHKKHPDKCTCALYIDKYELNNPEQEKQKGNILVIENVSQDNLWDDYTVCACKKCGQKFKIKAGESHYRWWEWEMLI